MPKNASEKKRNRAWTALDHAIRKAKKTSHDGELTFKEQRAAVLTRGGAHNMDSQKLRMHIVRTERQVDKMRERLRAWDDVEEEEEKKKKQLEKDEEPKKKSTRKGPESWKLRGAARPASEVYDFDVRHVDIHAKAHEEAKQKSKRLRNILVLYKGHMGQDIGPPQPESRNLLSLLMQLGHLNFEAKKYKAARAAFIECMDLDGTEQPVTSSRCHLMRLYLEANRPDSARRLWERLDKDTSVWIRYSAALVEYVSWALLKEKGSTRRSAELLLSKAIQANVFCAYFLAYFDTFDNVIEYTDDIEDAHEQTLEEAIEYCNSEQYGAWLGTDGAIEWVRQVILRALHGQPVADGALTRNDLEWQDRLLQLEDEYEAKRSADTEKGDDNAESVEEEEDEEPDVKMFAGMFRTGMEMLQDAGEFEKKVADPGSSDTEGEDEADAASKCKEESTPTPEANKSEDDSDSS